VKEQKKKTEAKASFISNSEKRTTNNDILLTTAHPKETTINIKRCLLKKKDNFFL
jgi:hypothetical protein